MIDFEIEAPEGGAAGEGIDRRGDTVTILCDSRDRWWANRALH